MTESKPRTLNCPTCGKTVEWSDAFPFRPFCSKRCQLIDFGDWAAEKHRIPDDKPAPADAFDDEDPGRMS